MTALLFARIHQLAMADTFTCVNDVREAKHLFAITPKVLHQDFRHNVPIEDIHAWGRWLTDTYAYSTVRESAVLKENKIDITYNLSCELINRTGHRLEYKLLSVDVDRSTGRVTNRSYHHYLGVNLVNTCRRLAEGMNHVPAWQRRLYTDLIARVPLT